MHLIDDWWPLNDINLFLFCKEKLHLFINKLHGSIPRELRKLENLIYLDLHSNELTGKIPEITSKNLRDLYLDDNMLSGAIPKNIYNLDKLKYLNLHLNMLSGTISRFSSKHLLEIDLGENDLTGKLPHDLIQSIGLEYYRLHKNKFIGTIPESITNLNNLTRGESFILWS